MQCPNFIIFLTEELFRPSSFRILEFLTFRIFFHPYFNYIDIVLKYQKKETLQRNSFAGFFECSTNLQWRGSPAVCSPPCWWGSDPERAWYQQSGCMPPCCHPLCQRDQRPPCSLNRQRIGMTMTIYFFTDFDDYVWLSWCCMTQQWSRWTILSLY